MEPVFYDSALWDPGEIPEIWQFQEIRELHEFLGYLITLQFINHARLLTF